MYKLQNFTLKLSSQSTLYIEPDTQSIWTDTIRCLVTSLPKIPTSLTIDKLGQTSRYSTGIRDPHTVCKVILAKDALPHLKHLKLRIHCICPSLFSVKTSEMHASLETLVVALDAYSPQVGKVYHAHRSLKALRILRYDVQALVFFSLDVVSQKEVEMPQSVEWDDIDWEHCPEGSHSVRGSGLETIGQIIGEELGEAMVRIPPTHDIGVQGATTLTINVAAHG
ncbi:hypothetical protein IFR04_010550 [Cadophora malorum]|uniref:Uncharacterized protein n=1 Tax=Cadophora malorum TaxID=108018 RepID=A0A8H7TCJ4_9HELO|nr:hypothetical protein IFR04_010550 [Cadophora malorum]